MTLTGDGQRRLAAATPGVRTIERAIEADLTPEHRSIVKRWLVSAARRLDECDGD